MVSTSLACTLILNVFREELILAMVNDSDEFQVVFILQRLTKTSHLGSDIENE